MGLLVIKKPCASRFDFIAFLFLSPSANFDRTNSTSSYPERFVVSVLNGTPQRPVCPTGRGVCSSAWPIQPITCKEDRNGAGTQELKYL